MRVQVSAVREDGVRSGLITGENTWFSPKVSRGSEGAIIGNRMNGQTTRGKKRKGSRGMSKI